jgi:hypothetical protein
MMIDLLQNPGAADNLFFSENKESIREDGTTNVAENRYT